jgi:hypothetical protein
MTETKSPRYTAVIHDEPKVDIDAQAAFEQIGDRWVFARMGARDLAYSSDYVQFDVTCDRTKRRVIITVTPDDTYSIEIGQVVRRTFEWRSIEVARGVYCDELGRTVEEMYQRAFS